MAILSYMWNPHEESIFIGKFLDHPTCPVIGEVNDRTLKELKSLISQCPVGINIADSELISSLKLVEPKKLQIVNIYTDGSAHGKTRLGGIGVYIFTDINGVRHESRISVGYSNTKIGRMELMAIITALGEIHPNKRSKTKVVLKSDSAYAVNCVAKRWLWSWRMTGSLMSRTNGDLLQKLFDVHETYPKGHVYISWVKGHSSDIGNKEADRLAGIAFKSGLYTLDLPQR